MTGSVSYGDMGATIKEGLNFEGKLCSGRDDMFWGQKKLVGVVYIDFFFSSFIIFNEHYDL